MWGKSCERHRGLLSLPPVDLLPKKSSYLNNKSNHLISKKSPMRRLPYGSYDVFLISLLYKMAKIKYV